MRTSKTLLNVQLTVGTARRVVLHQFVSDKGEPHLGKGPDLDPLRIGLFLQVHIDQFAHVALAVAVLQSCFFGIVSVYILVDDAVGLAKDTSGFCSVVLHMHQLGYLLEGFQHYAHCFSAIGTEAVSALRACSQALVVLVEFLGDWRVTAVSRTERYGRICSRNVFRTLPVPSS